MKKLVLLSILIFLFGCADNSIITGDLDFLSGTYEGVFLFEYNGYPLDTTNMYVEIDGNSYLIYYINISDCPFEGTYYLTGQFHIEMPTDTCQHNALAAKMFRSGNYSVGTPGDSLILREIASDTLRQYKLKRIY